MRNKSVIPATGEIEVGRLQVQSQPELQNEFKASVSETLESPSGKKKTKKDLVNNSVESVCLTCLRYEFQSTGKREERK